jgi:hypothetical protein
MKNLFVVAPALLLVACGSRVEKFEMPSQVANFAELYQGNCAGCHGREGRSGAARPLNSSAFLAVIGEQELTDVIAKGVPQTAESNSNGPDRRTSQVPFCRPIVASWATPAQAPRRSTGTARNAMAMLAPADPRVHRSSIRPFLHSRVTSRSGLRRSPGERARPTGEAMFRIKP